MEYDILHKMTIFFAVALCKEYLRIMEDPFTKPLEHVPASVDLREYGLITPPKDIGWTACGSGAAAVASLAESNILRAWSYFKDNAFIKRYYLDVTNKHSSDIEISVQYIMNNTNVRAPNRGYYCTGTAEHAINDMAQEQSLQFNLSALLYFLESSRKFNPEPNAVTKIILYESDPNIITKSDESVYPFYSDKDGNSLILLYHTPFFSLSGDESFGYDTVDVMKYYLARGVTLIAQIHLGSDRYAELFRNHNSSDVFAAECIHVTSKYQPPSFENMKKETVRDGYNKYQERMIYVNIVGYGLKSGQEVWIVKAPFGKSFGNLGYAYFPILNNTLCMEELVLTALPNHVALDEMSTTFTEKEAAASGLNQLYSIYNLISQRLSQASSNYATSDEYSGYDSFATHAQDAGQYIYDNSFIHFMAARLACQLSADQITSGAAEFTVLEQNCTTRIYGQTADDEEMQIFDAECLVNSDVKLQMAKSDGTWKIAGVTDYRFLCMVQNASGTNDSVEMRSMQIYIDVQGVGNPVNDLHPTIIGFPVIRCYYNGLVVNGAPINSALYPRTLVYEHFGRKFTPQPLKTLGMRPGAVRCLGSTYKRIVYDTLRNVTEWWDCTYLKETDSNHYITCYPKNTKTRAGIEYYGEVRYNVTSCMKNPTNTAPDFFACPADYNMNFTSVRVRLNSSNNYLLSGKLMPIMYFNVRPDSLSRDYLWLINITFPEIEARTVVPIEYPDKVTRDMEAECKIQTNNGSYTQPSDNPSTADFAPYQIQCRQYSGTNISNYVYVCQNLLWKCRAELFGWSQTLTLAYYLNFTATFPLILREAKNLNDGHAIELMHWNFTYRNVKYDYMAVESTKKDVQNFAFDPCKVQPDLNSGVCSGVQVEDLKISCGTIDCTPLYAKKDETFEFSFKNEVVHSYNAVTRKPELRTVSEFFCEFEKVRCVIDRRDLYQSGILCDYGLVSCKGVSRTTQTYYGSTGLAVATQTGTSVFMFNTTTFYCRMHQIKTFKAHEEGDSNHPPRDFVWGDATCVINNSQTSYSVTSTSPDYLIRDSNSIDDVKGVLSMQRSNVGLQVFFSVGLLFVVSCIIVISAVFSGWPGSTKNCCTRTWNKAVCCEKGKFYCTSYDKYGIPLVEPADDQEATVGVYNYSLQNVAALMRQGFHGLSFAKLQAALVKQEDKVASNLQNLDQNIPLEQLSTRFISLSYSQRFDRADESDQTPNNAEKPY